ncbi:type II toxin-antitoxin system PemK/MazF family toxin [Streptomyces sp. ICN441]|uniref:type II toxin-antitoxin system PemK/MazF family toxin n=1 Tax=Streptomyces sp. ICN441 TaxID=2558286 RepID=UPI0019D192F4|nr:type II toxin-antitoxin system PemK/MazF family toxin [Streptomyces sp. ICN441]
MDTSWWLALGAVVAVALLAAVTRMRPGGRPRGPGGRPARRPAGRVPTRPRVRAPGGRRNGPVEGGAAPPGPGLRPQPGEIWWADVPYEDGPGSKDRPCLVLAVHRGAARVAKITSRYHDERPGVIPLPPGTVGDAHGRPSFLETDELREVRVRDFRRRVGAVDPLLWDQLRHL